MVTYLSFELFCSVCLLYTVAYKLQIILFPGGVMSTFSLVEQCSLMATDLEQQYKVTGCRCSSVTKDLAEKTNVCWPIYFLSEQKMGNHPTRHLFLRGN